MLKWILPYVPKALMWPVATHYIAGETNKQCIARGTTLNGNGNSLAIDILGEHSKNQAETDSIAHQYRRLIQDCSAAKLEYAISLKLSHLGADTDAEMSERALVSILDEAAKYDVRVTLDMESTEMTDLVLDTYRTHIASHSVGTVLQAYLHRSFADAQSLVAENDPSRLHIRICKGIYKEPEDLVFPTDAEVCANYIKLAEYLYEKGAYVCIATHDTKLFDHVKKLHWDPTRFEFQVLLGVPVQKELMELREMGYRTTIYLPYGPDWHAYSTRRLVENPKLIRYVIKNMLHLT